MFSTQKFDFLVIIKKTSGIAKYQIAELVVLSGPDGKYVFIYSLIGLMPYAVLGNSALNRRRSAFWSEDIEGRPGEKPREYGGLPFHKICRLKMPDYMCDLKRPQLSFLDCFIMFN